VAGTFVIISGNFDLSTAAMYGVGSVAAAWLAVHTGSVPLALLTPPFVGIVLGAVNGLIITKLRIHSFLTTLATAMIYTTISVLWTGGTLISAGAVEGFNELGRGKTLGVFNAIWIMLICFAVGWILLAKTSFGRHVYAVGGNAAAAELSGLRVDWIRIRVLALSGLAAGIAASVGVSRIASGQPLAGQGLETQAIASVVLGGTSIMGGSGAVWRSVAGVYLIALIGNGFDLLHLNPQMKSLVQGVVIIIAVAISMLGRRRQA
jgi:ribose transport system permease protein